MEAESLSVCLVPLETRLITSLNTERKHRLVRPWPLSTALMDASIYDNSGTAALNLLLLVTYPYC